MQASERSNCLSRTSRAGRTTHDVAVDAKEGVGRVEDVAYFHGSSSYSIELGFPPYQSDAPMYIAEGKDRLLEAGMVLHLPKWSFSARH
jgi:hypothetical protein